MAKKELKKELLTKSEINFIILFFSIIIGLTFIPHIKYIAFLIPIITYIFLKKDAIKKCFIKLVLLSFGITIINIVFDLVMYLLKPNCSLVKDNLKCNGYPIIWQILSICSIIFMLVYSIITIKYIIMINENSYKDTKCIDNVFNIFEKILKKSKKKSVNSSKITKKKNINNKKSNKESKIKIEVEKEEIKTKSLEKTKNSNSSKNKKKKKRKKRKK